MLPRANDDSAARLLLAEHAEECGDGRMARAWRWMACMAKWPESGWGWWPSDYPNKSNPNFLPIADSDNDIYSVRLSHECESALAGALERGDL